MALTLKMSPLVSQLDAWNVRTCQWGWHETSTSPGPVWRPASLFWPQRWSSLSDKPHVSYPLQVKPRSQPMTHEGSPKRHLGTFLHTDSSPLALDPILSSHFSCSKPWSASLVQWALLALFGFQLPKPHSQTCPDEATLVSFSSLRDCFSVLMDVQCLKRVDSYICPVLYLFWKDVYPSISYFIITGSRSSCQQAFHQKIFC